MMGDEINVIGIYDEMIYDMNIDEMNTTINHKKVYELNK